MGYIDASAGNPAFSTSSNLIPLAKIFNPVCSVAKHFASKPVNAYCAVLRRRIAFRSSSMEPFDCFGFVFLNTLAEIIHLAKFTLCHRRAILGSFVFLNTLAEIIHLAKFTLCRRIAGSRSSVDFLKKNRYP